MPSISDLKISHPELQSKTDLEIVDIFAKHNNASFEEVANALGVAPRNNAGFTTAFKSSIGGLVQGVGQLAGDYLPGVENNNAVELYGREVTQRNPITIMEGDGNALENIGSNLVNKPLNTISQIGGAALGMMAPTTGLKVAAWGNRAIRGVQAAQVPSRAATVGNAALETTSFGLPSYGQMRDAQEAKGENSGLDLLKAGGSALAVGAVERLGGIESLGRRGLANAAAKGGLVKSIAKSSAEEAFEEIVQTPIEAYGSGEDPFTKEVGINALAGGVAGAVGGGMFGVGAYVGQKNKDAAIARDLEEKRQVDMLKGAAAGLTAPNPEARMKEGQEAADIIEARRVIAEREAAIDLREDKDVQAFNDKTLGVNGKPSVNRKDVSAAYNEKLPNPVVLPDENGKPFSTTDAYHLYLYDNGIPIPAQGKQVKAVKEVDPIKQVRETHNIKTRGKITDDFISYVLKAAEEGKVDEGQIDAVFKAYSNAGTNAKERNNIVKQFVAILSPSTAVYAEPNLETTAEPPIAKDASPEDIAAFKQKASTQLTATVTKADLEALQQLRGVRNDEDTGWKQVLDAEGNPLLNEDGTEVEMVPTSTRAMGAEAGVSHETMRKRADKALNLIHKAAGRMGIPVDAAERILGLHGESEADVQTVSAAQAAQAGLTARGTGNGDASWSDAENVRAESDDLDTTEESFAPDSSAADVIGMESIADTAAQNDVELQAAPEEVADDVEGEDTNKDIDGESGFVYSDGSAMKAVDISDAMEEWSELDENPLPKKYHAQWARAFIAHEDGVINDRIYKEIYNELSKFAETEKGKGSVPSVDSGSERTAEVQRPSDTGVHKNGKTASGGKSTKQTATIAKPETSDAGASSAEVELFKSLQAIARSKTDTKLHKDIAADYAKRAMNGEDVMAEATAWLTAIKADTPKKTLSLKPKAKVVDTKTSEEADIAGAEALDTKKFSKNDTRVGSTADEIKSVVAQITGNANNWRVTVYDTAAEAVASGRLKSEDVQGTQAWVAETKNGLHAFFIASNIPKGAELAVLLHEVGAHIGLERLLTDKQYESLVTKIFDWAKKDDGSIESEVAKAALARVDLAVTNDADYAPETIAYFIEEAVKRGINPSAMKYSSELSRWFRTLWAAFKTALHKLGVSPNKLSAQDVVDLAYGAARLELKGTWQGGPSNFYKHSNAHRGTGEGGRKEGDKKFTDMIAYGQYFADLNSVAKGYRDRATRKSELMYDGISVQDNETPMGPILRHVARFIRGDIRNAASELAKIKQNYIDMDQPYMVESIGRIDPDKFSFDKSSSGGALFNTDFNVADDEWLMWDRTLDEQSPKVKEALERVKADLRGSVSLSDWDTLYASELYKGKLSKAFANGAEFLRKFDEDASEKASSEYLDSLGIKGVKYEDNASRGNWQFNKELSRGAKTIAHVMAEKDLAHAKKALAHWTRKRVKNDFTDNQVKLTTESLAAAERALKKHTDLMKPKESTYNYVVFDPKNVVIGAKDTGKENRAMRFSKTDKFIESLPTDAQDSAHWVADTIGSIAKKGLHSSMFTSHLIEMVKDTLTSAQGWYDAVNAREVSRIAFEAKVDAIANESDKLSEAEKQKTWGFILNSTKGQKWGYKPDFQVNGKDVEVDATTADAFNKLSAKEQAVVKAVFEHGHNTIVETQKLLDKHLDEIYEEKLNAAKTPEAKAKVEKEKEKFRKMYGRKLSELNGPYTSMRRVGSHVVVAKSQAYMDAEAAQDEKAMDEMKSDEAHFWVEFTDSEASAKAIARKLRTKYPAEGVIASAKQEMNSSGILPFQAFEQLRRMSAEKNSDAATKLNNLITELYLTSLAETSARKSELKRDAISGLNPDSTYQAFVSKGKADAHYLSVLKHHKEVNNAYGTMQKEALNSNALRGGKMDVYNELVKRYENSFNYDPSPLVGKLMGINSIWMLLTKPAYYFYNSTQPLMMSQPYMAQNHGYNESMGQLFKAYKELKKMPSFNIKSGFMDLEGVPADVSKALHELRDMGRLDITLTQELGARVHQGKSKVSHAVSKMDSFLRGLAQKVEMTNRVVTAAAAYRLELSKSNDHAKAVQYAKEVIDNTHGDYSNFNAPSLMNQNAFARMVTQFRKFQLIQLSLLVREYKTMMAGKSADGKTDIGKWAAGRALRYTLAHHAIMAGGLGLPAANLVALAFSAMGGDDDKKDLELEVRNAIDDDFLSALLLHGVPAAMFNANISGNVGAGQMLSIMPYQDFNVSGRDNYANTLVALSGPMIGGLGVQFADAIKQGNEGNYYKMLQGLAPGVIKSSMKAISEAASGVTNTKGDMTVSPEEITLWDTALKTVGIRTESDSVRQMAQAKKYEFEQFFNGRTHELKNDYAKAYKAGDYDAMAEVRDHWMEMQGFKREYGFKVQPISNLLKAPAEQRKREKETANGVQFNSRNKGFVEYATGEGE
jgi:hypothetical protein